MLSVNYNPSVLKAQNNLACAANSVSSALERMSTGFRINSASDDAAGLYVATGLDTQIRGSKQAQKNVADGISLLNIAEGSLSNMKNMLQRVRDLGVQGANSVYDSSARQAMQDEAEALIEEVLRVQEATVFNGRSIFASAVGTNSIASASWKVNTASNSLLSPSILSLGEGVDSTSSITPLSTDVIPSGYTAIYTADDLNNIRNDLSGKYILMNDIDLSGYANWDPIGTKTNGNDTTSFTGIFDGNGHVIKNLTINRAETHNGLFGCAINAEIKNIGLKNVDITGEEWSAALVGAIEDTSITNCYSIGRIQGNYWVGGLIGMSSDSNIKNCYSSCQVNGTGIAVGGLSGQNVFSTFENCYAIGDVSGNIVVGGLLGTSQGCTTTYSYATGLVSGNSNIGGLIGSLYNTNTIDNCIFDTENTQQSNIFGYYKKQDVIEINNKGLTTQEMSDKSNWAGWDNTVWDLRYSPPRFLWENLPEPPDPPDTGDGGDGGDVDPTDPTDPDNPDGGDTDPDNPGGGTNTGGNGNPQGFGNIRLQVGANADAAANSIYIDLTFDIGNIDVDFSNSESCLDVIESADELLDKISTKISEIGAVTNRLESVQKSQITQIENFTAAKSTIMDADIAQESAEFVKSQILQRTTSALLTQAQNLYSSSILSLIR